MKTVTTDQKRRVVLPDSEPGEVYQVREIGAGRMELTKLVPAHHPSKSRAALEALLEAGPLTPAMTWESLRSKTREW